MGNDEKMPKIEKIVIVSTILFVIMGLTISFIGIAMYPDCSIMSEDVGLSVAECEGEKAHIVVSGVKVILASMPLTIVFLLLNKGLNPRQIQ